MNIDTQRKRVAVLISGRGSNMTALVEASRDKDYPAEIVGVLSNRADAGGLEYAREAGIQTAICSHRDYPDREHFDAELDRILVSWNTEIVCLAGFMRILTAGFVEKWPGRMINIHPSLLPEFRGLDTHARAIASGALSHGCTVHFVTPGLDEGPTIAQAKVPIFLDDTPDALARRVLTEEHRLYPLALAALARGKVKFGVN